MPRVQPTWLDRAIAQVAPEMALRRLRSRYAFDVMSGGYQGARRDRRATQEWRTGGGDANADLLPDLEELRNRSNDLERNAPLAGGAIATMVTNVVGPGLQCRPKIDAAFLGLSEDQADATEAAFERVFALWAAGRDSDASRTMRFAEQQALALRSTLINGDVLALKRFIDQPRRPIGYAIQLVEGHRLSTPFGRIEGRDRIFAGVELGADGAPVRYHIADRHPGAINPTAATWSPVPAEADGRRLVLHLYRKRRIGETRGVPYLAPVIESLKQLSRYSDAEISAAVISAFLTVFIKSSTGAGTPLAKSSPAGTAPDKAADFKLGEGAILDLAPGEEVQVVNPGRPNPAFDPFVMAVLRQVGVALELPFEILVKHFTASYSAARAALIEAWKTFMTWRSWLAAELCQPCYEEVITEAVARGLVAAPGFFADPYVRAAYLGADWTGPAQGQLNPRDEAQAAEKLIDLEVKTREQVTAELTGGDWERNHRQRAREERMRRDDRTAVVAPAAAPAPALDQQRPPEQDLPS